MLYWMALIPGSSPQWPCTEVTPGTPVLDARSLAWWCLQFTPRVALLDEAVVAELHASQRLFGGAEALHQRVQTQAQSLGCVASAHACTALAAVALARRHGHLAFSACTNDAALVPMLDALPLSVLPGVAAHEATLARVGCRTLADVRALPRAGLSRRFGAGLLNTLDQAYGLHPEAFEWLTLPKVFDERLELPGRVESAVALGFAAHILLQRLCAWLAGLHAGVHALTLRWQHDFHRRSVEQSGERTIRLANPSRDLTRLGRLLDEHLKQIKLEGPVGEISLHAHDIGKLDEDSRSLFPEIGGDTLSAAPDALITPAAQKAQQQALLTLMERLSVRLGPERVQQGQLQADHRPECAQRWHPAPQGLPAMTPVPAPLDLPQPFWLLPQPQPLTLSPSRSGLPEHPMYQGRLQLLAGPHRIEAGWWEDQAAARDYYLASSERAGLLWVYRERHPLDAGSSPWFLHGFFA